jgi:hypothetical protein
MCVGRRTSSICPLSTRTVTAPGDYGLWPRDQDRLWTLGANLYITPHVVVKVDYQHFMINKEFTRFDLGLGLKFWRFGRHRTAPSSPSKERGARAPVR